MALGPPQKSRCAAARRMKPAVVTACGFSISKYNDVASLPTGDKNVG
jgi:hypothetical protein